MAKVHGLVYIAVGSFVSIASWKIDYERFIFFFFIGLAFVLIGFGKIIFSLIKKKKGKKNLHDKGHAQLHRPTYCSSCGSALKPYAKFCANCGARV